MAYGVLRAKRSDYAFITQTPQDVGQKAAPSFWAEFFLGIASGLSNPKNIVFYLSLFSVVLTPQISMGLTVALGVWMVLLVFVWDAMIIFVLSQHKVRRAFGKVAFYVDKTAGILLGLMGGKLLHSAVKETV